MSKIKKNIYFRSIFFNLKTLLSLTVFLLMLTSIIVLLVATKQNTDNRSYAGDFQCTAEPNNDCTCVPNGGCMKNEGKPWACDCSNYGGGKQ